MSELLTGSTLLQIFTGLVSIVCFFIVWWFKSVEKRLDQMNETVEKQSSKIAELENEIIALEHSKVSVSVCADEQRRIERATMLSAIRRRPVLEKRSDSVPRSRLFPDT